MTLTRLIKPPKLEPYHNFHKNSLTGLWQIKYAYLDNLLYFEKANPFYTDYPTN